MSRLGKNEVARHEGARWVVDMIEKKGLDETLKDLKWRGVLNAPLSTLDKAEIERFQVDVKRTCVQTVCAMSCLTLLDEFGFSKEQLEQFIKRFNFKTECLDEDFATWDDYVEILKDEVGIDISIPRKS